MGVRVVFSTGGVSSRCEVRGDGKLTRHRPGRPALPGGPHGGGDRRSRHWSSRVWERDARDGSVCAADGRGRGPRPFVANSSAPRARLREGVCVMRAHTDARPPAPSSSHLAILVLSLVARGPPFRLAAAPPALAPSSLVSRHPRLPVAHHKRPARARASCVGRGISAPLAEPTLFPLRLSCRARPRPAGWSPVPAPPTDARPWRTAASWRPWWWCWRCRAWRPAGAWGAGRGLESRPARPPLASLSLGNHHPSPLAFPPLPNHPNNHPAPRPAAAWPRTRPPPSSAPSSAVVLTAAPAARHRAPSPPRRASPGPRSARRCTAPPPAAPAAGTARPTAGRTPARARRGKRRSVAREVWKEWAPRCWKRSPPAAS
jgi:hypothetical protein